MQQAVVKIPVQIFEEVMSTGTSLELQGRDVAGNRQTWKFSIMGVIGFQHDLADGSLTVLVQHPDIMKSVADQPLQVLACRKVTK